MKQINHFYFKYNGVEYRDYTLYLYDTNGYSLRYLTYISDDDIIVDDFFSYDIQESNLTQNIPVPKGSSVHIVQPCKFAIADVRKNYVIKRKYDSGDYNVFTPNNTRLPRLATIDAMLILPKEKCIVGCLNFQSESQIIAQVLAEMPDKDYSDSIYTNIVTIYRVPREYKPLLNGTSKKPCVSCDCLDLNTENQLTADILECVYKVGSQEDYSKNAAENLMMQFNLLNQYNWRNYPGTVGLLISMINYSGPFCTLTKHESSLPKHIKEIIRQKYSPYKGEEDRRLGREFLEPLLQIKGLRYASITNLNEVLQKYKISTYTFCELYNVVARITPKEDEEEEKD